MKTVLEIWEDFKNGDISRNEADKLMKAAVKEDGNKAIKHIPGRYNQAPFWTTDTNGCSVLLKNTLLIEPCRTNTDCCKTKEEAESVYKQQKTYLTLIDKIHELNKGWVPDWADSDQAKYSFRYDHDDKKFDVVCNYFMQSLKNELHFKSEEIGDKIIEEVGKELIKLAIGI